MLSCFCALTLIDAIYVEMECTTGFVHQPYVIPLLQTGIEKQQINIKTG